MNKQKRLITLILAIISLGAIIIYTIEQPSKKATSIEKKNQSTVEVQNDSNSKLLIGYVQDFRDPYNIDYANLSHIVFSFVHPTEDGDVLFSSDLALQNLKQMVIQANESNTKVMLAVGGWSHLNGGQSYDYFLKAISQPTSRTNLVTNLIEIIDREKLDGIDIDFEHPRSLSDAQYLTSFTKELSKELHAKGKQLSIAVHAKIDAYTKQESNYVNYEPGLFQYADLVNIMAYEGQWDNGYHAENLSSYAFTERSVIYWHDLFTKYDFDISKLILGVPLYGQPEDLTKNPVSYASILQEYPAFANQDTFTMNDTQYHFNGSETIKKKTKLAIDYGFGGMMMWEVGLDTKGENSLTNIIKSELEK